MPATAGAGPVNEVVVIKVLSAVVPQALLIVHVKVYTLLAVKPVTIELGKCVFENITPAAGETVQVPVSFAIGVLPYNIKGELLQTVESFPASAAVGITDATLTITSS